jgi:hypothetical protein
VVVKSILTVVGSDDGVSVVVMSVVVAGDMVEGEEALVRNCLVVPNKGSTVVATAAIQAFTPED